MSEMSFLIEREESHINVLAENLSDVSEMVWDEVVSWINDGKAGTRRPSLSIQTYYRGLALSVWVEWKKHQKIDILIEMWGGGQSDSMTYELKKADLKEPMEFEGGVLRIGDFKFDMSRACKDKFIGVRERK